MTADTVGGVWTYALELARGLTARSIEVGIATMGAPLSPDQRNDANAIRGLELFESSYKLEWMEQPWEDVGRAGDWLLDVANRFKPSLVHLNNYCHGYLPFGVPVMVVGHSCVLSWWQAVFGSSAPREWDRYRDAVARGLAAAALVLAPSRAMLDSLQRHYGPLPRAAVAYNGCEIRSRPEVSKQPFLFASGRLWDEAKNVALLEGIAAELPWPVYVAGDNRHPDGGTRPGSNCHYLGRLSAQQMAWWMERAAIYVLPARYEPFGLSILEAAQAGCALVLGNIPSLREIWSGAALFVSPEDRGLLQKTICSLIESPALRIEMAGWARARARNFSNSQMVQSYLAAYHAVLTGTAVSKRAPNN